MPSLYELGAEWERLEAVLIESAGEMTPEVEAAWDALGEITRDKVDAYQHVVANLKAHATGCSDEATRLALKADAALNAAKRLTARLHEYMTQRDVTELKGEKWKAVIQKNGGKQPLTVLVSPEELPKHLQRTRIEADTDSIRAVLEAGRITEIEGVARLEPVGSHLRFR